MKEKNDLNPKSSDKEQNENELGVEKPSNESKLVKDTDNKFYSLSEIDLLHGIFDPEGKNISQLRFRDVLMSEHSYGSVVNDRNYVIRKKEIKSPDEAIANINMSGWSHGESFESDRTANYKGVCKVLTDIMLDPEQPFNYGHRIYQLPSELGNLKRLVSLNLNHNRLADIPSQILDLRQLETLNLEGNVRSDIVTDFVTHLSS